MRSIVSLLFLIFSVHSFAATLEVQAMGRVSVGVNDFKAILIEDDGTSEDVTHLANFSSLDIRARKVGSSSFELEPSRSGYSYNIDIKAEILEDDITYSVSESFNVDNMPDYIDIRGPYYVPAGGYGYFRARGCFNNYCYDLTDLGHWRAWYGYVSFGGNYRAPYAIGTDQIEFEYGLRRRVQSIQIHR